MKKLYLILSLLFISVVAHAQPYETNPDFNRTRNWLFGEKVGLHFSPDTVLFTTSEMPPTEACAVHTDQDGNLLLYSNGENIWDANHKIIHNGDLSLGHYSSRMGSVFVLHEDNPNFIYLININDASTSKELSYNLIVMEADTFRLVVKDSVLFVGVAEPITAVKAENGKDIWLISHIFNGSSFISFLLTEDGIINCPVFSNSKSYVGNSIQSALFAMKFSPDGKYLIRSNTHSPPVIKSVELYKFDLLNGELIFLYTIDSLMFPIQGVNFSKKNNIYIIERDGYINVFNFHPNDSTATIISQRKLQLQGFVKFNMFKSEVLNLTYGNKLAINVDDSTFLGLLFDDLNLDSLILIDKGISLNNNPASLGLPNFNQSYYYTPSINFSMKLNCVNNTILFQGQDTFQANSHNWEINKEGGTLMTASIKNPLIEFEDSGIYSIRYIASNGSRSDTITKEVVVYPKIKKKFLGNDTGWCEQIGASLTLQTPNGMHCYEWSTGETTPQITIDSIGTYIAKITTPNFCVLYDTITITIDTIPNTPTIYKDNDTLKTDDLSHKYQWFRNDMAIGVNQPYLVITDTGIYHLRIMSNGGCTAISDTIHIPAEKDTLSGNVSIVTFEGIKIYPNPFNSSVVIENPNLEDIQLTIYSIEGRETLNRRLQNNLDVINTEQWTVGIYLIKLTSQNGLTRTFKLLKI